MEADFGVEIGPGLGVIDADWPGWVDLRVEPARVGEIAEAAEHAALREALEQLNGPESPVFTCKCDVWRLGADEIDADEFWCGAADALTGVASYVDVVARNAEVFGSFKEHESWARRAVEPLKAEAVSQGRADLVVRAAVAGRREGFGITLYAAGCGVDKEAAEAAWERVLRAAVTATMSEARFFQDRAGGLEHPLSGTTGE